MDWPRTPDLKVSLTRRSGTSTPFGGRTIRGQSVDDRYRADRDIDRVVEKREERHIQTAPPPSLVSQKAPPATVRAAHPRTMEALHQDPQGPPLTRYPNLRGCQPAIAASTSAREGPPSGGVATSASRSRNAGRGQGRSGTYSACGGRAPTRGRPVPARHQRPRSPRAADAGRAKWWHRTTGRGRAG